MVWCMNCYPANDKDVKELSVYGYDNTAGTSIVVLTVWVVVIIFHYIYCDYQ